MKEITKYVCEFCSKEHDDYNEAFNCENQPEPINGSEFNVGDQIHFGTEDGGFGGGRWCYSSASGYIIEKNGASLEDGTHVWYFIVEMGQRMTKQIRGVFWIEEQGGWYSPYDHNLGFKYHPQDMTEHEIAEAAEMENRIDEERVQKIES
jgi:hypothetical protein